MHFKPVVNSCEHSIFRYLVESAFPILIKRISFSVSQSRFILDILKSIKKSFIH